MQIDYVKRRIILNEPTSLKRLIEEFSHLGLEDWDIIGVDKGSYLIGLAEVDDWVIDYTA